MKRAGGDAVKIREKLANDGAKTHQVEVGVAQLERVKRPLDQGDSAAERFFALKEF